MAVTQSFVDHVLDLLTPFAGVAARKMFGGYGLFLQGSMFGLLDDDELFLKVDDITREQFLEAGCRQWVYESPKGPMPTSYYRPPDGAFDDPESMRPWAERAIEASVRARTAKPKKGKAKKPRSQGRSARKRGPTTRE